MTELARDRLHWWIVAAIVGGWSALVRIVVTRADDVEAFYYPDSWNYVVPNVEGYPPHPFHGPFVYWLWDLLIPGTVTEGKVVALQQVLGVAAVVLVALSLRRLVADALAVGAGLFLGIQPLAMFFERSIMTEAWAMFLFAAALFLLGELRAGHGRSLTLAAVAALGLVGGALVALRPSSRVAAALLLAAGLFVLMRRATAPAVASRALMATILVTASMVAPLVLMIENRQHYGSLALTPASGTALLSEYGWLASCDVDADFTARARAAVGQVCDRDRPDQQPMWLVEEPLYSTFVPSADFATTQGQLSSTARGAILRSPVAVTGRLVDTGWRHTLDPELQLRLYGNGDAWFREDTRAVFPSYQDWFGEATREPQGEAPVFRIVRQTQWLPGVLFLALTIVGVVAVARALLRIRASRRRRRALRAELRTLDDPTVFLVAVALGAVTANEMVVAFGGIPIVRYWAPMLPPLVIAGAGMIELVRGQESGSSAPQSTG